MIKIIVSLAMLLASSIATSQNQPQSIQTQLDSIWKTDQEIRFKLIKLQQEGKKVYAIEQAENAVMLDKFEPLKDQTSAVIFGNEVKGVQQEVVTASDAVIEIPQLGSKHSLNISVSTGVVVWDLFSKLQR